MAVTGSATYNGGATGVYVHETVNSDGTRESATAGQFAADAMLTANFGGDSVAVDDQNTVTGTIDNFALAGEEEQQWSVALKGGITIADGAVLATGGAEEVDNGTANGGGAEGSFSATFYGSVMAVDHDMDDGTADVAPHPSSVVGEFDANFSNGTVAGGFGARRQ